MPAKPTDKRTAVGRAPAASVQGDDVRALVADDRFATPPGEHEQADSAGATAKPQSSGRGADNDASAPSTKEVGAHGRSNNEKGYQEAPDDARRAAAEEGANENPALLHHARDSASDAESTLAKVPADRRAKGS